MARGTWYCLEDPSSGHPVSSHPAVLGQRPKDRPTTTKCCNCSVLLLLLLLLLLITCTFVLTVSCLSHKTHNLLLTVSQKSPTKRQVTSLRNHVAATPPTALNKSVAVRNWSTAENPHGLRAVNNAFYTAITPHNNPAMSTTCVWLTHIVVRPILSSLAEHFLKTINRNPGWGRGGPTAWPARSPDLH